MECEMNFQMCTSLSSHAPLLPLDRAAYHDTSTGAFVSRSAHLFNTTNIEFPSGNVGPR
jgi:hypothetical protein